MLVTDPQEGIKKTNQISKKYPHVIFIEIKIDYNCDQKVFIKGFFIQFFSFVLQMIDVSLLLLVSALHPDPNPRIIFVQHLELFILTSKCASLRQ